MSNLLRPIVWSAIGCLIFAGSAWPARNVLNPQATPNGFFINQPTVVKFTVQVDGDPNLIVSSANLVRYDINQRAVGVVGTLYDDGTHGDVRPGDGFFTGQVTVNESNQTTFYLRASVAYKGSLLRVLSALVPVHVVHQLTQQDATTALAIPNAGLQQYQGYISQGASPSSAQSQTIAWLLQQPGVAQAGPADNGLGIWVAYTSGVLGGIILNPAGTKAGFGNARARRSFTPPGLALFTGGTSTTQCGNLKAVVIGAFTDTFAPSDESLTIPTTLQQGACPFQVTTYYNAQANLAAYKNLGNYGIVVVSAHGDTWYRGLNTLFTNQFGWNGAGGQVIVLTRESPTIASMIANSIDLLTGRVVVEANFYAITPSFITNYSGTFPKSIIYMSSCRSAFNSTMANAFTQSGANTYYGYSEYVFAAFSFRKGNALFTTLVTPDPSSGQIQTTGQAFVPETDTSTAPGATGPASFLMFGDQNTTLPNNLVSNPSFETGDMSSWTVGGTSYSFAEPDNATDGVFSARVGRWDELYAGGLNGPPQPGAEPYGYDSISQDVQLPTLSGGRTSITLTFTYHVMSFDSAIYDWFDMFIQNSNNATIATVVSHAGNPSSNWGPLWDGGTVSVSYDLTPFAGQTIRLFFGTWQDGYGDQTTTFIDNVQIRCR